MLLHGGMNTNILAIHGDTPITVDYLAEGAANVVFRVWSRRGAGTKDDDFGQPGTSTRDGIPRIDGRLRGKLLRLRKDLSFVAHVIDSHRHFEKEIEPLFPAGSLVDQSLCKVSPDFVKSLNDLLRRREAAGLRSEKRRGAYLAENELYATAITNMLWDDEHVSCEFKPKWLTQSPSAPSGAKRCRTCALRAMRQNKDHIAPHSEDYCPLALVADDQEILSSALNPILSGCKGAPLDLGESVRKLRPFLRDHGMIKMLRDLQIQKDPHGIFKTDPSSLDFMTAMTLRDCTMFLKIPTSDSAKVQIEARLGDLDLKTPNGNKAEYWKQTEQQLINEGWYTATEKTTTDVHGAICLLSKSD
ncbi:MAG: hypothetical protein LQ345_005603 [Seirophora villosa]|nr:MAG: hypothetical protein LQ345_005603 [Seirophora villosa]